MFIQVYDTHERLCCQGGEFRDFLIVTLNEVEGRRAQVRCVETRLIVVSVFRFLTVFGMTE